MEFLAEVKTLPPKKPGVVPKLVVDLYDEVSVNLRRGPAKRRRKAAAMPNGFLRRRFCAQPTSLGKAEKPIVDPDTAKKAAEW